MSWVNQLSLMHILQGSQLLGCPRHLPYIIRPLLVISCKYLLSVINSSAIGLDPNMSSGGWAPWACRAGAHRAQHGFTVLGVGSSYGPNIVVSSSPEAQALHFYRLLGQARCPFSGSKSGVQASQALQELAATVRGSIRIFTLQRAGNALQSVTEFSLAHPCMTSSTMMHASHRGNSSQNPI